MENLLKFEKNHEKLTIAFFKNHEKLMKKTFWKLDSSMWILIKRQDSMEPLQSYNGLPLFPINLRQLISESC